MVVVLLYYVLLCRPGPWRIQDNGMIKIQMMVLLLKYSISWCVDLGPLEDVWKVLECPVCLEIMTNKKIFQVIM
jgi:hypothetical protein